MMKRHAHNAFVFGLRNGHFKTPLLAIALQLLQRQRHLFRRVFVDRQFDNEVSDRMQVLWLGGANRTSMWL